MERNFKVKFIVFILFLILTISINLITSSFFDNKVNDFFTKTLTVLRNNKPTDDVVLVEIDSKSLSKVAWPWRRDLFSDIFDYLENISGAKVIVFNNLILFPDTYYPENDSIFNNKLKDFDKVISSYILFTSSTSSDILPEEYLYLFDVKSNVIITDKRKQVSKSEYRGVSNIPKEFLLNSKIMASSIIPEDKDEIVRNYMPVVMLNEKLYPSLALSAYALYSGIDNFTLDDKYLCSADNCESLKIPVSYFNGKDYIGNSVYGAYTYYNWYKPIGKYYTHKKYSAIDILLSYYEIKEGKSPKINPELFKDKIVIIGLNADKNVWDRLSETPVLKKQSDIDVHATMISNMLQNSFMDVPHNNHVLIITIIFCFFVVRGFRHLKNNLIFVAILSLVYFIYYLYEYFVHINVPLLSPILTMYATAMFKFFFNVITSDKNSELMKNAMSKYVSKDVMKKVVSNLDKINVGGVRKNVSILFVDIRNFTQISETLPPNEVTSILNEYFRVVEPIITKYKGVVNKYMGDGILAIFGEPVDDENHPLNAVNCGMEILREAKYMKEKLISENKPKIDIGLAINTGDVFIGNIGTENRLEYTVIGDNVNLAYRIESYNHTLKTQFLISESTYGYVKKYVDVIQLSQVAVKGKSKPINIYEVLRISNNDR